MNYEIKVAYTLEQAQEYMDWLSQGDLSVIALDTETMGKNWYDCQTRWYCAPEESNVDNVKTKSDIEKEQKQWKKEALDAKSNLLATLQLALRDGRSVVFILKDPMVANFVRETIHRLDVPSDCTSSTATPLSPTWLIQNAKFDLTQLSIHWGLSLRRIFDTRLAEVLLISDKSNLSSSLRELIKRYSLPEGFKKGEEKATVSDWWTFPLTEEQIYYAGMDCLVLHYIYEQQRDALKFKGLSRVAALENKITPALVKMEEVGVKYDRERLNIFVKLAETKRTEYETTFKEFFGDVNPSSPKQVVKAIEEKYGVVPMTKKWDKDLNVFVDKPSVDKFTLLEYGLRDEEPIKALIAIKEISKNIQQAETWLNDKYDRFYPSFIQLKHMSHSEKGGGARTGRITSSPNLLNLSNFMKQFIIADDDWVILDTDFSAIELRLVASYAGEEVLKKAFIEGRDPHTEMAAWAFQMPIEKIGKKSKERRIAKEVNFGFIYGMYGRKFCSRVLRATNGEIKLSAEEGTAFRDKFFERYPAIDLWHKTQFAQACIDAFVTTRSGRRREYNEANRPSDIRPLGRIYHPLLGTWFQSRYATDWRWRNIAYNTPIQGTGADGDKEAIANLYSRELPWWFRPFVTVYDNIGALVHRDYIPEGAEILEDAMIRGMSKYLPDIPVVVETTVGKSWANAPAKLAEVGDIRKVEEDYGLWVQSEFQTEIKSLKSLEAVA